MKLTQDREVFVNGHKNYKDTKKAERAAFYDFCAKYEGDALPLPKELASRILCAELTPPAYT